MSNKNIGIYSVVLFATYMCIDSIQAMSTQIDMQCQLPRCCPLVAAAAGQRGRGVGGVGVGEGAATSPSTHNIHPLRVSERNPNTIVHAVNFRVTWQSAIGLKSSLAKRVDLLFLKGSFNSFGQIMTGLPTSEHKW